MGYFVGAYVVFIIIAIVIDIIVAFLFSNVMNQIKEEKGYYNNFHFFALCFWLSFFGWFITGVIVISLPDLKLQSEIKKLSDKLDDISDGDGED